MGTDDNASVAIGVGGVTITLSQNGVDDLYSDDIAGDIGISGAMGDLDIQCCHRFGRCRPNIAFNRIYRRRDFRFCSYF